METFGSEAANDNWGWVDLESGKEYVLCGLDDGTAFIDISDPKNPIFLGKLPTATTVSPWRDIKVYENHAFIVSEAPEHGLQVFDLTRLRLLDEFQILHTLNHTEKRTHRSTPRGTHPEAHTQTRTPRSTLTQ